MEILFWSSYYNAIKIHYICSHSTSTIFIYQVILNKFISYFRIITIGHSFKDGKPLSGCRKPIIKFAYQVACRVMVFISGVRTGKIDRNDYNYEAFLGPDYKS